MWIDPFWGGVILTLAVEVFIIFSIALVNTIVDFRREKKHGSKNV